MEILAPIIFTIILTIVGIKKKQKESEAAPKRHLSEGELQDMIRRVRTESNEQAPQYVVQAADKEGVRSLPERKPARSMPAKNAPVSKFEPMPELDDEKHIALSDLSEKQKMVVYSEIMQTKY